MNRFRFLFVTLLTTVFLLPIANHGFCQQKIDWKSDIKFLKTDLPKKHVNFFAKVKRKKFEAACDQALNSIQNDTLYGQAAVEIMKLVAMAQDGHTAVRVDFRRLKYYPLNARIFDDGVFVIAAPQSNAQLFGAKIVSIGGVSVEQIIKRYGNLFAHDNPQQLKNVFGNNSNVHEYLVSCGAKMSGNSMPFVFERNGKKIKASFEPMELAEFRKTRFKSKITNSPRYMRKSQLNFWNDWIADQNTLYFKYNRCKDFKGFNNLVNSTIAFEKKNDVQRFVIDLRNNSGGNSAVFKPLLNYLKQSRKLNRTGKLFAIIGRQTFSSGMWAALDLRRETNVVIVGEPTGGKPNHFGEIKYVTLPASKLRVSYSTKYWHMLKNSDPEAVEPDVKVKFTSKDYFSGKAPYLDAVFKYKK